MVTNMVSGTQLQKEPSSIGSFHATCLLVLLHLQRRAMLGLPDGDTDPFMDTLAKEDASRDQQGSDSCSDAGSEFEFAQEPPELLAARQQLAAHTARPDEEEPAGGCTAKNLGVWQHSLQYPG
jgi:hypothetical protein